MRGAAIAPGNLSVPVRIILSLFSSVLVVLSFPNPDQGWLAWIALVPLILACSGSTPAVSFLLGLVSGAASTVGIFYWIFEVSGFRIYHMLMGSLYFGLYPAAWCLAMALFRRIPLPAVLIGPVLWVGLDYLKGHAGFLAFPWAGLAHTQHNNTAVLQVASFAGEAGVTFLVVMSSVAIADMVLRRNWRILLAATIIIVGIHVWGIHVMSRTVSAPTVRVAAVQPAILNSETGTDKGRAVTFARLERLTRNVAETGPLLIVWPETAVRDISSDPSLAKRLQDLADGLQISLLTGASEHTKFVIPEESMSFRTGSYNSAYSFMPGKSLGAPYRKVILVPFGEYIPLKNSVPWPLWFVPKTFNTMPGTGPGNVTLGSGQRLALVVCWENLFADFVRSSLRDGAGLIVHLTNDNWFGPTAAPRQHNLASVLRAVENRTPVVIASNTGPSQIIDHYGRVVASMKGLFNEGFIVADVQPSATITFYGRFGNLFVYGCFLIVLAGIVLVVRDVK